MPLGISLLSVFYLGAGLAISITSIFLRPTPPWLNGLTLACVVAGVFHMMRLRSAKKINGSGLESPATTRLGKMTRIATFLVTGLAIVCALLFQIKPNAFPELNFFGLIGAAFCFFIVFDNEKPRLR